MRKFYFFLISGFLLSGVSVGQSSEATQQIPEFELDYEKFTLDNGLEVILHEDHSDPIVAVATMMHVGSNREKPGKTGFAHFFEHMSFNDSENVPVGANRKMIPEWGGSRNGGTWSDGTVYYEVVPKDAFEKILWIDSDRFGYMINTVTQAALDREKQVVKNEKRQRVDNAPYGYTDEIIRKNLYPKNHPYNWTVIGQLPDLQSATLEDVKEFYKQYYGAANASLVIAGDIEIEETKKLVRQWFGEIPSGPEVEPIKAMPVKLETTKNLYFEDNFAKLPELRMVYPTVEDYDEDMYALQILGQLLSGSKKSPLYQTVVEESKFAPRISTYQSSSELAGEFVVRVRANAGIDLDSVQKAIQNGFKRFEEVGVREDDLKRIKAELETQLYQGVSTVLNKAFQLVQDNEFNGDPGYLKKTAELTNKVTSEDVMRVYNKYIKDQHFIMTSVVPKGSLDLAIENSEEAEVWIEEVKSDVASEEVSQGDEAVYDKTPSKYDRSEPEFGDLPLFKSPEIWTAELKNGMQVYGIENNEIPLVEFDITIPGGQRLDPDGKEGVSYLLSDLMLQGTATKTPAELEEALGLLGANVYISTGNEDFRISGTCLSKNFAGTMKLVEEILMQPRWDATELSRLKQALETNLNDREANPQAIASTAFYKLLYGDKHSFGVPVNGTLETTTNIAMEDLKSFYSNLSPEKAKFHIAGAMEQKQVLNVVSTMATDWATDAPMISTSEINAEGEPGTLYFIDVPDAKQSVIMIGKLVLTENDEDASKLHFANEILGGGSSGKLFQTLRIEKGYTYGAYSGISENETISPFYISTSVRANATLPSLKIIEQMVTNYSKDFGPAEVELTQNKLLKENTRSYESLGAKLGILRDLSKYDKSEDFIESQQEELMNMTEEDFKSVITEYLNEKEMIYLVVGDKATQLEEVKKLGKPVIELDIYANEITK
ncbi:zinc protease [Gramella sp. Hel_I_59]|uniref:M16 family metallopeptidase n=1 Tax=Gramella sp. Hel_I_59 TaxID=1249978 RepID=UPI00114F5090|nr:pitrilysin family protein [Gramella sp. Hel_I_59]TQI70808.1 zinc protease [Gramella sp. Hel_I_59]